MKEQGVPVVRSTSPVHIHVDDQTPIHVHVKKIKNPQREKQCHESTGENESTALNRNNSEPSASATRRKSRSKSPSLVTKTSSSVLLAAPWVPPPARTSKGTRYAWQGSSQRLAPTDDASSQLGHNDLDTDEEGKVQSRVRQYEKTIESLMKQVSSLKKELQDQKKDEESTREDDDADAGKLTHQLLKQLDKVDRCAESVSVQMNTLHEALQQHKKEAKSGVDIAAMSSALSNNRQLLIDKMAALDRCCQRLRHLLTVQRDRDIDQQHVMRHRQQLIDQVKNLEMACEAAKRQLAEKDAQISELKLLYDMRMDEVTGASELQGSLELNKSQLERQLRQRDIECSQLALELRNVQNELSQERNEVENLRLLLGSRTKSEVDRKTKSSRKRDCNSEVPGAVESQQVTGDRESLRIEISSLKTYCDKLNSEKTQVMQETNQLKVRVAELEMIIERMADDAKNELAMVTSKLQDKTAEVLQTNEDLERLRSKMSTLEYKLAHASTDVSDLQSKVREYETLIEEYRSQLTHSRRETDEAMARFEDSRREVVQLRQESEMEIEKVKQHMQSRLSELEPMPELLKSADAKVHQLTEQLDYYRKMNTDNSRLVAELTNKVDQQTEYEAEKRDLLRRLADREDTIHQANVQVQEVMCENASLKRKLESLLADNQRRTELERDKLSSRERAQRAQILDLETQLNQLQTEVIRLKHDKEDSERRFNSQLYDLRDRLEQSHSTNRSLQNYVEFLKNSYTSVFADHITSSPLTQTSTFYHRTA